MSYKELYRLTEGASVFPFTSSNEQEEYNGEIYVPRIVGRSEIADTAQISKATVDVSFAIGDSLGQHLINSSIDTVIRLDIFAKEDEADVENIWRGRLRTVSPGDKTTKVTFESVFSSNRRIGARPIYQRTCRHAVYGPGCKLHLNDFKTYTSVNDLSGDGLSFRAGMASAQPDGYYNGGIVLMNDGTMRYIVSHVGNNLIIIRPSDSLNAQVAAGSGTTNVYIAPGCSQTEDTCFSRFNNLLNFGGWRTIPLVDPIGGTPIV